MSLPVTTVNKALASQVLASGDTTILVTLLWSRRWRVVLRNPSVAVTAVKVRKSATSATDFGPQSATLGTIAATANAALEITGDGEDAVHTLEIVVTTGGTGTIDMSSVGVCP